MQQTNAAITSGVGPLIQLGVGFQTAGTNSTAFGTDLSTLDTAASTTNQEMLTMNTTMSELGPIFAGAGTETQAFSGALGSMNTEAQAATGGLTNINTVTNETTAATTEMSTAQETAKTSTSCLGVQVATLGGLFVGAASSIFGLVRGLDDLERAQVKSARANLIASKAQAKYNDGVAKFGPQSAQAQAAARDLAQAQDADRIAHEKAALAANDVSQAYVQFGLDVAGTAGTLGGFAGTLSQIVTEFRRHRAEQAAASVAAKTATTGFYNEAAAAGVLAGGLCGISASMAVVIGIAAAVVAALVLIETNTFGLGDAFRSTTTVIAQAIDAMIDEVNALWNGFVVFLNNLARFNAEVGNAMRTVYNGFVDAFNGILATAANFVNSFMAGFSNIANFFIRNVINPAIGAWNNFLFGLETTGSSIVGKIVGLFSDLGSKVVGAMLALVSGLDSAFSAIGIKTFKPAVDALTGFQKNLQLTGQTAQQAASQSKSAWAGGIPTIPEISADFGKMTAYTVGTKLALLDTAKAGSTFNGMLITQKSTVAQNIASTVNYYSSWNNVAKVLQGTVSPALQNVIKWIFEHVKGGQQLIATLLGVGSAQATSAEAANEHASAVSTIRLLQKRLIKQ